MKTYHKAHLINARGEVSALCFKKPKSIDLGKSLWTNRDETVTCKKCLDILNNSLSMQED